MTSPSTGSPPSATAGVGGPTAWQGWGVLLAYFALVLAGIPFIQIGAGNVAYFVYVLVLTAVLVGVCWLTGERPRWRWGKRDA